jgi:tetratricopeptide (TPR) repeat protein
MARREWPITEVDRLHGEYSVAVLRNDWPFVPKPRPTSIPAAANRIEEIAQGRFAGRLTWADAMSEALVEYQRAGNNREASRVAVNLADAFVTSADAHYKAGVLLLRADEAARGLHYLRQAVALDRSKIEYRLSLAQAQFMLGRTSDSIATLEEILKQQPGETRAEYWLDKVRQRSQEP